jgi:hypothetical protein
VDAQQWIEVAGLALGGGGGAQLVAKVTRVAVAVENLLKSYESLTSQVGDHEKRLGKAGL